MKWHKTIWTLTLVAVLAAVHPLRAMAQSPAQNSAARALFLEGRDFWDDGKFVDAEKKFREALTKYPKAEQSDKTAYYLITTLIKLNRIPDVRTEINEFGRNYPQSNWRSDVEEKRMQLGFTYTIGRTFKASSTPSPRAPFSTFGPGFPPPAPVVINVSLEQEIVRQILEKDPDQGIEVARERLRTNPADPAVMTNLSTIAHSHSAQAVPFLVHLAGGPSSTPNARDQATFWLARMSGGKDDLGTAFIGMMKDGAGARAVTDVMVRFNTSERRMTLDQILKSSYANAEKLGTLQRIYRDSSNLQLRSQVVEAAGSAPEAAALPFLTDVVRNEKDPSVRYIAVQALGIRKDVDPKTLIELLNSVTPRPASK